jgi:hypothetical protein
MGASVHTGRAVTPCSMQLRAHDARCAVQDQGRARPDACVQKILQVSWGDFWPFAFIVADLQWLRMLGTAAGRGFAGPVL